MPATREMDSVGDRGDRGAGSNPSTDRAAARDGTAVAAGTGPCQAADDYIHPDTAALFARLPFTRHIPMISEAMVGFGPLPVLAIGVCYFTSQGVSTSLLRSSNYAMLAGRFGADTIRYQRLGALGNIAYSLNPLTAMISDTFAFGGYTKRWYVLIFSLLATVFALAYGLLPAKESSINKGAAFMFLAVFSHSSIDALLEGFYTRKRSQCPKCFPGYTAFVWASSMAGSLVANAINGPVSDMGKPQINMIVSGATQGAVCIVVLLNLLQELPNRREREEDAYALFKEELALQLGEDSDEDEAAGKPAPRDAVNAAVDGERSALAHLPDYEGCAAEEFDNGDKEKGASQGSGSFGQSEQERRRAEGFVFRNPPRRWCGGLIEYNAEVMRKNWRIFIFSCVMAAGCLAMAMGAMFADTLGLLLILVIVATVCSATSFWALPLVIAKVNMFVFLSLALTVSVSSPVYTFYVAPPLCNPGGPNFSYTLYSTVGPIVGSIAGILGLGIFNALFRRQRYRFAMVVTTLINIFANVFDIIIVKRWNMAIGIPDTAMFLFGSQVLEQFSTLLLWMPTVLLISQMCPRGSETMVFAALMGFRSLGRSTSSQIGSIVLEYGWVMDQCDFSDLPMVQFVCCILCPLLIIPLVFLVPNARVCDDINVDGEIVRKEAAERMVHAASDEPAPAHSTDSDAKTGAAARS
ncbi:putative pteridine transporter [Novymonas esmeraldas]|uniref:Pteridine transporter n=1 Tax=Novymonas esmeraldas TaxID=1808958 RepID=A0AAW0F6N4_9TRYP